MSKPKSCEECKFFIGEVFRSINPNLGYCDNKNSLHYRKNVDGSNTACESYEE
jgi:hypothetical protein